jgi:hypothetical protein
MEVVIAIVLVIALIMWANSRKAKAARRELRYFEYGGYADDGSFRVDFVTMRGQLSVFRDYTGDPLFDNEKPTAFHVRRISSSKWQTKVTADSWKQESAQIAALLKKEPVPEVRRELQEELEQLGKWQPMSSEIVGPLETQYQRFLLHGEDT